jgi:Fic family protein
MRAFLSWFNGEQQMDPVLKAGLAQCSQDTTGRDINDLVEKGVLAKAESGGRSTAYSLVE